MKKQSLLAAAGIVVLGLVWLVLGVDLREGLLGGAGLPDTDLVDEHGRPILVGTGDEKEDLPVVEPSDGDHPDVEPAVSTGVRLEGRVLDQRRVPVAGAGVVVTIAGRTLETTTGADGTYAVDAGERPDQWTVGIVRASAPGRSGAGGVVLHAGSPDVVTVAPVLLATSHELEVRIEHAGQAVPDARVVLAYSAYGRMTPISEGRADGSGLFRAAGVPEGSVRVFAAAEGYGRANVAVGVPREKPGPVVLELTAERTLDVVVVDQASGAPVEGATVYAGDRFTTYGGTQLHLIPPVTIPPTDGNGRTTVRGLNAVDSCFVAAWKDGYARPNPYIGRGRLIVAPDVAEAKIELSGYRTVRFGIEPGALPPPADGTVLALELQEWMQQVVADDASAVIEAGELVVSGLPNSWIMGRVVTPERTFARFTAGQEGDRGEAVTFAPLRSARIRVVDLAGAPIVGRALRYQGGPLFGWAQVPTTDANGEAVFDGVTADKITVFLMKPGQTWGGQALGQIDLAQERDVYELVAGAEHALTIEITIDGEPALPSSYTLVVGRQVMQPGEVDEDPATGTLIARHRLADSGPVQVTLSAEGFLPAETQVDPGRDATATFALEPAGTLIVHVIPPTDGAYVLRPETFDEERGAWRPVATRGPRRPGGGGPNEDGTQTFEGLDAGLYRVVDWNSGIASQEVDVRLGGPPAEVDLDLSQVIWIQGVVVAPDGTDFARARVVKDGSPDPRFGGTPVDKAGKFRVRAVRGETITLTVRHDLLAPAAEGGSVRVVAGSSPVTLRLEPGNTLTFLLPSDEGRPARGAQVKLFLKGDRSAPAFEANAVPTEDGAFQVGGFAPGRYTLWIDTFSGTPIVREGHELRVGANDMGLLVPGRGSAVVVKLLLPSGAPEPRVWISALWGGTPTYGRGGTKVSGSEYIVEGLLHGSVTVRVTALDETGGSIGPREGHTETIEVDGSTDAVIEVDLR